MSKTLIVLAGGRGERLSPLSDVVPKPLTVIGGKPFIEHLISIYAKHEYQKILILVGYKSHIFEEWYTSRKKWLPKNVKLIIQSESLNPTERILDIRNHLSEEVVIAYGDSIVNLTQDEVFNHFSQIKENEIRFIKYLRSGHGSKPNLALKFGLYQYKNAMSETADCELSLNLGLFFLKENLLDYLDPKKPFENTFFELQESNINLIGIPAIQKYYSLTNLSRIAAIERFLDPKRKIVIFDRDGTLNKKPEKARYLLSKEDYIWKKNTKQVFKLPFIKNVEFYVFTNQPGIGKNLVTKDEVDEIHGKIFGELLENKKLIKAFFVCPHDWNDGCDCRKPKSGLLIQAQEIYDINFNRTLVVGDDERDFISAGRLGADFSGISSKGGVLWLKTLVWLWFGIKWKGPIK